MIIGQLRITEHREETLHIVHVPAADIPAESAAVEHARHVFHVADIPFAYIAVEIAAVEHVRHIRHIADIPLADVTVECLELVEKLPHILDCGRIDAIQVRTGALALDLLADSSDERRLCFRRMLEAGYDTDVRILHGTLQKVRFGDIDLLEFFTVEKSANTYFFYRVGDSDSLNGTASKRKTPDFFHGIRYFYDAKAFATAECPIPDSFDGSRNGYFPQVFAHAESVIVNFDHG